MYRGINTLDRLFLFKNNLLHPPQLFGHLLYKGLLVRNLLFEFAYLPLSPEYPLLSSYDNSARLLHDLTSQGREDIAPVSSLQLKGGLEVFDDQDIPQKIFRYLGIAFSEIYKINGLADHTVRNSASRKTRQRGCSDECGLVNTFSLQSD